MVRNVLLLTVVFSLSYLNVWAEMLEEGNYSHNELVIQTADKVTIRGSLFSRDHERVIIYCHRLLGSQGKEEVQQLLEAFIDEYDLITFNFRGHQSSTWMSTMGGDEVLDLRAVISFAVKKGYGKIVVLGAGMGGSVAIRTAGIFRNIDALIVVSPSGFSAELQPFLVRMGSDIMLDTEFGRVSVRILTNTRLGTRYTAGYPIDIIATVSPIPLVVVQSENDRFVRLNKVRDTFGRALEPKKFILVPGSLHAEKLLVKSTLSEIRGWLNGVFSEERDEGRSLSEESLVTDHPDSIRIVLTGDLPIPEEVIVGDLYERLYGPARTSYKAKMNAESIGDNLKRVFSFYGYTVVSVALSDSVPLFTIRVSIPHIHAVSIEGNQWVTDDEIRRFLNIDGDYYNSYELDRAIRRVSSHPAIQTVTAGSTMREDGTVDLSMNVVEKRPYRLLLAAKFTDLGQFYGPGFTWNESNPSGVQLAGQAMVGVFDRNVYTSLGVAKSVWGHHMRLGGKYFDMIKSRDDLDYIYTRQEVHERGGEVTASYRVTSTITANLGVFGKEYKSPEVSSDFLVQEGRAIGHFLKLDVSGKLPLQGFPRFNWKHTLYYQNTGLGGLGGFNFKTVQLNLTGEFVLWRRHRSVTTFHYGRLSEGAPVQEQFSLGGMTTLPGYPDDSFVNTRMMRASQAIYLDASSWVDETSWLAPVRLILPFHAGTVWGDGEKFAASNVKMVVGFELDYKRALRVGIAVPVGPQRAKSPRVYIGWGTHVL